ncbi:MAG: class I SAM-dependent methyltransferase [Bacteroidales bacterium]|nr:class I SAM-dependent methyltransferase [Bacteroidales bacterium]
MTATILNKDINKINIEDYSTDLIEKDGILFSKIAGKISYPENGNENCYQIEENSYWFNHRNNCIAAGVLRYCSDRVFFDVGGGNGFVANGLEKKGISTVMVEPGLQGCFNAKNRNLKNIVCSTLENAAFRDNTIPAIGLFDVVEHIENDVEFLTRVHKLVTDNGYVFITVPAYNTLWSNEDIDAGHYRRYTREELEEKLKAIGFSIVYSTYIFSILMVAVFLFRALPYKLGLNNKTNNPEQRKKDHESKKGIIGYVLNGIWKFEVNKIRKGKMMPFGGSCFLIAKKTVVNL